MTTIASTSEIVESTEEFDSGLGMNEKAGTSYMVDVGKKFSIADDINRLFQEIDIRTLCKRSGQQREVSRDALRKSAMKRPVRVGSSHMSGIGISEPVSLKQALRGLCISQAAEMAATKRSARSVGSPRISEAGTIKRLYRAVVVEANGSGVPAIENKANLVEISIVSEKIMSSLRNEMPESLHKTEADLSNQGVQFSSLTDGAVSQEATVDSSMVKDLVVKMPTEVTSMKPPEVVEKLESSSFTCCGEEALAVNGMAISLSEDLVKNSMPNKEEKGTVRCLSSLSSSGTDVRRSKSAFNNPRFIKPIFRTRNFGKKKAKLEPNSSSGMSDVGTGTVDTGLGSTTEKSGNQVPNNAQHHQSKEEEKASSVSSGTTLGIEVSASVLNTDSSRPGVSLNCCNRNRPIILPYDERSRSREKGMFSQSSKSSSIGDCSSSPSISGESILSGSSRSGFRPHMSKDLKWEAIHRIQNQHKSLGLRNFKLLKRLGLGDIGTVYLSELRDTNCLFAIKVMDKEFLVSRKKVLRAQTEREILQMLDHPFLPTLYAHFETDKLSCLVIDYCPGGDLHVLRQKQPCKSFSEHAVRFYVAEVLLSLEYLHMLGVVYRDLKPENVLVREDGHIMLTDFDLSLRCAVNPMLLQSSSPVVESTKRTLNPCDESSCIDPFCLHPTWQVSCFTPKLLSAPSKSRRMKSDNHASLLPQLVVEPTSARSNSFVGTHEYLAPEIIKGDGHGSAVDWWTYGIFLFELLYGKTPFKGSGNEDTLANIVSQNLRFPDSPIVSFHARDLIRCLLAKEPESRLGSTKGAMEIKHHPFFEGLNWALIRCSVPPELPKFFDGGTGAVAMPIDSEPKQFRLKQSTTVMRVMQLQQRVDAHLAVKPFCVLHPPSSPKPLLLVVSLPIKYPHLRKFKASRNSHNTRFSSPSTSLTTASMANSTLSTSSETDTKPFCVLFVCLGNICRSPAAEGVFRDLVKKKGLDSKFRIDSAGTINYHEGNEADPRMRATSKRRGIEITSISRPIQPSDFKDFDLILAMDKQNREDILKAFNRWSYRETLPPDSHKKVKLMCSYCKRHDETEVPDPYYGGQQGFEKVLDLLEDACESLLESILAENKHISDS